MMSTVTTNESTNAASAYTYLWKSTRRITSDPHFLSLVPVVDEYQFCLHLFSGVGKRKYKIALSSHINPVHPAACDCFTCRHPSLTDENACRKMNPREGALDCSGRGEQVGSVTLGVSRKYTLDFLTTC